MCHPAVTREELAALPREPPRSTQRSPAPPCPIQGLFFFNPKFPRERPLSISFLSLGVFEFVLEKLNRLETKCPRRADLEPVGVLGHPVGTEENGAGSPQPSLGARDKDGKENPKKPSLGTRTCLTPGSSQP